MNCIPLINSYCFLACINAPIKHVHDLKTSVQLSQHMGPGLYKVRKTQMRHVSLDYI
jgi:hypothetical protein